MAQGCQECIHKEEDTRQTEEGRENTDQQAKPEQELGNQLEGGEYAAHRQDHVIDKGGVERQRVIGLGINSVKKRSSPSGV